MAKQPRNQVAQEVQARLNAGERKETIYRELKDRFGATVLERTLAQWPYPEDKAKNRFLNLPLLIIIAVFTLTKALQLATIFPRLELSQQVAGLLTILIHGYILYGIKNYNLIGYVLVFIMAAGTLLTAHSISTANALPLALTVTAVALAWLQKLRLFPNVSLFLRHKKDSSGTPIF